MALLSVQDVSINFSGSYLLDNVKFQVEQGERVCLLGRNGTGKSTLLRVIQGEVQPDSGQVVRQQHVRTALLPQDVPSGIHGTIFDVVTSGLGLQGKLLVEYHHVSHRLAADGGDQLLNQLDRLQHELEAHGGWEIHRQVEQILSRMQLNPDAVFDTLSAGMKRRALLAQALVCKPDVLLLDEPTNHLDLDAILWLENFLSSYTGTLLFVTHDRRFLKTLATRIIELDRGCLSSWACDYETFLGRKAALLEAEAEQRAQFDKKLAQEEIWIRKGVRERRTRNEGRVRALMKMRDTRRARRDLLGNVKLTVQQGELSGKRVVEANSASFGYNGQPIFQNFSTSIIRGDKVGILGPNGCGKTTLLKVLLGQFSPSDGEIRLGSRLEIAYFDQLRSQLDEEKTVLDNVREGSDMLHINGRSRHIMSYLQDFLFSPERAHTPVFVLSGGERNRLLLAKLFTKASNVLVLDEPTNDLDAETLELLENLLVDYQGTVLLVSHDREFLNNVVTSTMVFEGRGQVREYVGGYDDWLAQQQRDEPQRPAEAAPKKAKPQRQRSQKLSYKERRELEALPQMIEALEITQQELYDAMAEPTFYQRDGQEIAEANARLADVEQKLTEAYDRWEVLEALNVNSA